MNIKLPVDLVDAVGLKKFNSIYDITEDEFRWKKKVEIDLNELTIKKVEALELMLTEHTNIRGIKNALKEIKIWYKARTNVDSITVKKLEHLESLLFKYIQKLPNYWLFQRHGKFANAWLPFYISTIKYTPAYRDRYGYHPAYITMTGIYEQFGKRESSTFTFYKEDVRGKKIDQILLKYDLFKSTDESVSEYKKELTRYEKLIPQIGKQFTVDGSASDDVPDDEGRHSLNHIFTFSKERRKNRVVIDSFFDIDNEETDDRRRDIYYDSWYWKNKTVKNSDEDDEDDEGRDFEQEPVINIPTHPFLVIFDLFRHLRLAVHVTYLHEYVYDEKLSEKLILDEDLKFLVTMLVEHRDGNFKDIVAGKGGGAIILLTGKPGVGKTLTAEVFAEADRKPLYSVQASQLGTDPDELEKNLMRILQRASRWNAIMLLDEADVYVHERGNDLIQNAIVGVFLRVLEYHSSVLFLTSNRPDLVDDAIASRCVARIDYEYPSLENQIKIWKVLAEVSSIKISKKEYVKFADKHSNISGRDVKNLLKLANLISNVKKEPITFKLLEYVLKFKPTESKQISAEG